MEKARKFPGLGLRLARRLAELGYLRPYDFCETRGYMPDKMRRWVRGQTPTIDELHRLAADLGVSVEWLLLGKEEPAPAQRAEDPTTGSASVS